MGYDSLGFSKVVSEKLVTVTGNSLKRQETYMRAHKDKERPFTILIKRAIVR